MFTNNNNFYGNGAGAGFGAPQQGYGNFGAPVGAFQTQVNPMSLFRGGNSTLTKDEIQSMKHQGYNLWDVPAQELLPAMCNHYDADGNIALVPDGGDGTYECTVCHTKGIKVIKDLKYESVKKAVDNMIDIINSVKVLHFHQNRDVMRGAYQIIPLLKRFPEAYKIAVSDFNSVVKNMNNYMQPAANSYYNNPAAAYTSPGIMNMYTGNYGAAPMYGQQQPQQYGMMGNNCYQNQGMMPNYYGQQQPQNGFAPGFNAGPSPVGGMQNVMQSQFVQGGVVPQPTNPTAAPAGNTVPSVASYFENVNGNNAASQNAAPTPSVVPATASYQPANATGEASK